MTQLETKLIEVGTALARSIGHSVGCPKLSPAIPCACGGKAEQAKALDDWLHLVRDLKQCPRPGGHNERVYVDGYCSHCGSDKFLDGGAAPGGLGQRPADWLPEGF